MSCLLVGASLYTLHTELSKEGEEGGDILADGVRVLLVVAAVAVAAAVAAAPAPVSLLFLSSSPRQGGFVGRDDVPKRLPFVEIHSVRVATHV